MKTKILEMMTALLVWLGLKKEETKALPYLFYATIYENVANMTPEQRAAKADEMFKRNMTFEWKPYHELMTICTYNGAFVMLAYLEGLYQGDESETKKAFLKMAFDTDGFVNGAWKNGKEVAQTY
jgi:hypothetical protein